MPVVYCLYDPNDNLPKYIGKTIHSLDKRLKAHMNRTKQVNKRTNWMKSLKSDGLAPIGEVLFESSSENDLNFWEEHYIWLYRSWGFDLKNGTFGGDGGVKIVPYIASEKTKKIISENAKRHAPSVVKKNRENGTYERAKQRMLTKENPGKLQCSPILQYNLSGDFIKEWNSIKEASDALNLRGDGICRVVNGINNRCGVFTFRHKTKNYPLKINTDYRYKRIIQYDKNNNVIFIWNSLKDLSKYLGVSKVVIKNQINSKKRIVKIRKSIESKLMLDKFTWKYEKN